MYRIGTTDVCNDFTWEKYVSSYRSLLVKNIDSLILEDGKVIFETDYNFGMDSTFRKKLIELTEKQFGRTSIIVEEETNHDELTIQLK